VFVFVKTERGSWRNDEPKGVVRPRTSSATPSVSATEAAALKPSTPVHGAAEAESWVRDIKVEIPATPLEPPDRSTWRYPRSSACIGGQICFSSGPARKPKPDIGRR
jgi:hypothetical protein